MNTARNYYKNKRLLEDSVTNTKLYNNKNECLMLIFDTETTGLGTDAKIIQLSAQELIIKPENDTINGWNVITGKNLNIYINPEEKLNPKITEITGITDQMLFDMKPEKYYIKSLNDYLSKVDILLGYNVKFDIRMLEQMYNRCNYPIPSWNYMDVLEFARDMVCYNEVKLPDNKLGTIANYFCDGTYDFHNSAEDVKATVQVFIKCIEFYRDLKLEEKREIYLEKGSLWINPYKKSDQRIVLTLSEGEKGDIYYNIIKKCWSCKAQRSSMRLFKEIDIESIEKQFMEKYAFGKDTIDEVASGWLKFKHKKEKEIVS